MDLKERIQKKRLELGLNQSQLAKIAGLQPPAISQYESGARNPSYDALIKLSSALNIPVDYLISGTTTEKEFNDLDPVSEVLLKTFHKLSHSQKKDLMDYLFLKVGHTWQLDFFSTEVRKYADFLYDNIAKKTFPINIYEVSDRIGIKIIHGDLNREAEAILYKRGKTVIIDSKVKNEGRKKFAIASLIGHYVMPWHTDECYYIRRKGESTLASENIDENEASLFATYLITPYEELVKDFSIYKNITPNFDELIELATEKYAVSIDVICNRLVDYFNDRFAVVVSKNNKISSRYSRGINIKEIGSETDIRSLSFELFSNSINYETKFNEGKVKASLWIEDAQEDEFVIESSEYSREFKRVFTLLTKI